MKNIFGLVLGVFSVSVIASAYDYSYMDSSGRRFVVNRDNCEKVKEKIKHKGNKIKHKIKMKNCGALIEETPEEQGKDKGQAEMPAPEESQDQSKDKVETPAPEKQQDQSKTPAPEKQQDQAKTPAPEKQQDQAKTPAPEKQQDQAKTPAPEKQQDQSKTPAKQAQDQSQDKAQDQSKGKGQQTAHWVSFGEFATSKTNGNISLYLNGAALNEISLQSRSGANHINSVTAYLTNGQRVNVTTMAGNLVSEGNTVRSIISDDAPLRVEKVVINASSAKRHIFKKSRVLVNVGLAE